MCVYYVTRIWFFITRRIREWDVWVRKKKTEDMSWNLGEAEKIAVVFYVKDRSKFCGWISRSLYDRREKDCKIYKTFILEKKYITYY